MSLCLCMTDNLLHASLQYSVECLPSLLSSPLIAPKHHRDYLVWDKDFFKNTLAELRLEPEFLNPCSILP